MYALCGLVFNAAFLERDGLIGGDGNHFIDVVCRASAAQVVDRTCNALKNGADGLCMSQALDELVGTSTLA